MKTKTLITFATDDGFILQLREHKRLFRKAKYSLEGQFKSNTNINVKGIEYDSETRIGRIALYNVPVSKILDYIKLIRTLDIEKDHSHLFIAFQDIIGVRAENLKFIQIIYDATKK
jgi:hypothetical protein